MPQPRTFKAEKFSVQYRNAAEEGSETVVEIFEEIGEWWGYGLQRLAYALHGDTGPLRVRLNSPGGDVFQGLAIMNFLRTHPGAVTVEVLGVAASAATFITAGADRVVMNEGSFMMIHNPWTITVGDASDLESDVQALRKIQDEMVTVYAGGMKKRKKKADLGDEALRAQIQAWMDGETWFTSAEAVEHGFADEVRSGQADDSDATIAAAASYLKTFRNAPKRVLNLISNNLPDMDKKEPAKSPAKASVIARIVKFFDSLEADAPAADTATDAAPESAPAAEPDADPVELAKKLLAEAGYTVAEPETPVEAAAEEAEAEAPAVAAKYTDADLEKARADAAAAVRAEMAKKAAAKNPANKPAEGGGARSRADDIRARMVPVFDQYAEKMKS